MLVVVAVKEEKEEEEEVVVVVVEAAAEEEKATSLARRVTLGTSSTCGGREDGRCGASVRDGERVCSDIVCVCVCVFAISCVSVTDCGGVGDVFGVEEHAIDKGEEPVKDKGASASATLSHQFGEDALPSRPPLSLSRPARAAWPPPTVPSSQCAGSDPWTLGGTLGGFETDVSALSVRCNGV